MIDMVSNEEPLSRRGFLAGLVAAATAATLDPFEFVQAVGSQYENVRLGLRASLPEGWAYSSVADFVSLRAHQVLLDEVAEQHHALKNPEEIPVFIFEHPGHRDGHFAPGIVLYDNSVNHIPEDEPSAHLVMLRRFARSYEDLDIGTEPEEARVGNVDGTIGRWSYVHEVPSGRWRLAVRSVLVFRGDRAHTFHLVDDFRLPRIANETWTRFLASIQYT